jgi:hypothetical protein
VAAWRRYIENRDHPSTSTETKSRATESRAKCMSFVVHVQAGQLPHHAGDRCYLQKPDINPRVLLSRCVTTATGNKTILVQPAIYRKHNVNAIVVANIRDLARGRNVVTGPTLRLPNGNSKTWWHRCHFDDTRYGYRL